MSSLVGLRAGKPRLPAVWRDMGVACVDVDAFLERKHGRSAAELSANLVKMRCELEYEALVECANMGPLISCGEGIVAYDKSRELQRRGFAVMPESSEATFVKGRIHNLSTRPLLAHDCDIEGLWEQRKPLYEEVARAKINVQGRSTGSVALCSESAWCVRASIRLIPKMPSRRKLRPTPLSAIKIIGIRRAEGRVRRRSAQMLRTRAKRLQELPGKTQPRQRNTLRMRPRERARRGREEAEWFWCA